MTEKIYDQWHFYHKSRKHGSGDRCGYCMHHSSLSSIGSGDECCKIDHHFTKCLRDHLACEQYKEYFVYSMEQSWMEAYYFERGLRLKLEAKRRKGQK